MRNKPCRSVIHRFATPKIEFGPLTSAPSGRLEGSPKQTSRNRKRVDRVDRCIVLVDAGYLLGAAAGLLAGEPSRSRITVDHAALIQGLRERAESDTERPLLRIYWFDGAPTAYRNRSTADCA